MTKVNSITIDSGCFSNNTTINSVDLGNAKWTNNSLSSAFKNCTSLTSISQINSSITNLDNAFEGCSLLSGDVRLESSDISSASNCFKSTSLKKNVFIPYESTTYNTLTALGYDEEGSLNGVYLKDKDGEYDKWYNWKNQSNDWHTSTTPSAVSWYSSQYAYGKYFIFPGFCAKSNVYVYSEDGLIWTKKTLPLSTSYARNQSIYANGKIIITNHNSELIEYTEDGIIWNTATLPSSSWWGLAYGNGKYIATGVLGYEGSIVTPKIAISSDGVNWTNIENLPTEDVGEQEAQYVSWRAACYGNGKFVVMPCNATQGMYSYDGLTWNTFYMDREIFKTNFYNVAYGNGIFIAMSNNRTIYAISTDGINWTPQEFEYTNRHDIYFDGTKFIAMPESGNEIITTVDGINWIVENSNLTEGCYETIVYSNGKYVTIPSSSSIAQTKYETKNTVFTDIEEPSTINDVFSTVNNKAIYGPYQYIGVPQISEQGIASNFADPNATTTQTAIGSLIYNGNPLNVENIESFELVVPFKWYGEIKSNVHQTIMACTTSSGENIRLQLYAYTRNINFQSINSSGTKISMSSTVPTTNTQYFVKITFNKINGYKMLLSTDNTSWEEIASNTSTDSPKTNGSNLILGDNYGYILQKTCGFNGEIDLSKLYIKVNNEEVFRGIKTLTISSIGEDTITLSDEKTYIRNPQGDDYTKHSSFDPSALKYGDRLGDGDGVATVVGDFTDNNGQKYKFAVLDAKYMGYTSWADELYYIDTGLPNYTSEEDVLAAKESATYNTDYILENYSDKLIAAFTHCDNAITIELGGATYKAKLPNAYELKQIYDNKSDLYSKDPTASDYIDYNLSEWRFNFSPCVWCSNESSSEYAWALNYNQGMESFELFDYDKYDIENGVIPILEIPYE